MLLWIAACAAPPPVADPPAHTAAAPDDTAGGPLPSPTDSGAGAPAEPLPILFIHGINGHADNWDAIRAHLADDGWSTDQLYAETFADPEWGCNVDNAATIDRWVDAILRETGAGAVDLVAHSMGTLSSRYYLKDLGGTARVRRYVTLGGMHHGLSSACSPDFPFKPCVWDEICARGEFVAALNADPATPGPTEWVSIYGTADSTIPNSSSILDGAENIAVEGVEHDGPGGLLETASTYVVLRDVLARP